MCEVPVFGVVGGFCGCVMGVMGLWFVFGGGGGYCFRLSPGRGSGLTGRGFWPCLLGLGGCGGGWKLGFSGWFLVAGLMVWVCGWGFSGVGLVSAPSDD